ncbi:hypothetical protein KBD49_13060 [Myxococcota bacterium]|jgi:mevalonate kinase|nr:hypothetical protein [Myxococcota bacterium]
MTACGKAILNGEHFVLYGAPALAIPLPACRLRLVPGRSTAPGDLLPAWQRAREALGLPPTGDLPFRVESDLPTASGLGSSAALSVALVRLAARQSGRDPSPAEVARAAREVEHLFHGTSSGLDPAVVAWEAPILWTPGGEPEVLPWSRPDLEVVLAVAPGSRSTAEAVRRVQDHAANHPEAFAGFLRTSRALTEAWADRLRRGRTPEGAFLREAQAMLRAMGLSSPAIEALVETMEAAGAIGAKITGAGIAGAVLALGHRDRVDAIVEAARHAGATRVFRAGLA